MFLKTIQIIVVICFSVFSQYINIMDYPGADPTGNTSSSGAIDLAINAAANRNLPIYFPSGIYKISKTINLNFFNLNIGIIGDGNMASHLIIDPAAPASNWTVTSSQNWTGNVAIYSRSGPATFRDFNLKNIRGTLNLNGILFDFYGGYGNHKNIRVKGFNGFGIRYDNIWDSYVENLIVDSCGNNSNFAFQVNSVNETSNHTNFNRIQVEQSYDKAIFIHPNNVNLVFTNIHSERLVRENSTLNDISHSLRGVSCSYLNARIEGGYNLIEIGSADGSYRDFRCNDAIVSVNYGTRDVITVDNLVCNELRIPMTNLCQLYLTNSIIRTKCAISYQVTNAPLFIDSKFGYDQNGNSISGSTICDTGNSSKAIFQNCNIGVSTFTNYGSTINEFINTNIISTMQFNNANGPAFVTFQNSNVGCSLTTAYNCVYKAFNSIFTGNISLYQSQFYAYNSLFSGNLTNSGGSSTATLVGCSATGTVDPVWMSTTVKNTISGSLGIGTANPGAKLDVKGEIKFGYQGVKINAGTINPTTTGVAGNIGDLYVYVNGTSTNLYVKHGNGTTNWSACKN